MSEELAALLGNRHEFRYALYTVTYCIDMINVSALWFSLSAYYFAALIDLNTSFCSSKLLRIHISPNCNQQCVD